MRKNLEFARVYITVKETCADVTIMFENFTSVDLNIDLEKFESFNIDYEFDEYSVAEFRGYRLPEDFLNYVVKYGDRFDNYGYKVSYFDAKKKRRVKNPGKRVLGGSPFDFVC